MYQGKGKARNNFQFFSDDMHERTHRRLSLEHDLRRADLVLGSLSEASFAEVAVQATSERQPQEPPNRP